LGADNSVFAIIRTLQHKPRLSNRCVGQTLTQNEQWHERGELLTAYQRPEDTPAASAKEIDELDDAAVARLYHASLKNTQSFRRGPGVL
jgi:hypothetical protein